MPLLIFKLTGSPLDLSFTVAASVLPYLFFGLVIGAWVDRVNRKRLMILTDLARALVIASIPLVSVFGLLSVWWIYAVVFVNSTLSICFDAANFAAIPGLVSQDDLVKANGRIQASYSTARILGPLLAGLLILLVPLPALLLIDGSSFLISAGSLVLVRTSFNTAPVEKKATTSIRHDILEGLQYVLRQPVLRSITLLLLFINFIIPTAGAQLVLFAKEWLHASDSQVGFLYASGSIGTVLFSLVANQLRKRCPIGTFLLGAIVLEGVFIAAPALAHVYWVVLLLWGLRGGVDILFLIGAYSLVQVIVPNHLLGRVITFTRVLTWSTASLGALIGGFAVEQTKNVSLIYGVIGILVAFTALIFFLSPLGHAERYLPASPPSP
ncbi:MAG: MFS transporter [Chloroflexi bacterium]|nr:MAG: MFS transporter [Chloroflexota bacterium]